MLNRAALRGYTEPATSRDYYDGREAWAQNLVDETKFRTSSAYRDGYFDADADYSAKLEERHEQD